MTFLRKKSFPDSQPISTEKQLEATKASTIAGVRYVERRLPSHLTLMSLIMWPICLILLTRSASLAEKAILGSENDISAKPKSLCMILSSLSTASMFLGSQGDFNAQKEQA